MKRIENVSRSELNRISRIIGEAFVSNELFHELGSIEQRRRTVLRYIKAYVKCAYHEGTLYQNSNGTAFIGLQMSNEKREGPMIRLMLKIMLTIPIHKLIRVMRYIKQIEGCNRQYTTNTYLEVLLVCVDKDHQGQGLADELVSYAKNMAIERKVPLLFDTDMKDYADMYQHLGCRLYNTMTATNGVTRYSLVWNDNHQN